MKQQIKLPRWKQRRVRETRQAITRIASELNLTEEAVHDYIFKEGLSESQIRRKYLWKVAFDGNGKFAKFLYV